MKEHYYDKLLNIHTTGKITTSNSDHYYPYEPTPYHALETLFDTYEIKRTDRVVDFGCGLGRLNFFIHYFYHAFVVGIEMNRMFYQKALDNQLHYAKKTKNQVGRIEFNCCLAEEYSINPKDNRFYFFNPFSVHIFQNVVNHIIRSVEDFAREVDIILYYASEDYVFHLQNNTPFELVDEIILPGIYEKNPYERFLIYRLVY
ncbi:methyltransferase [Ornithinibacillus contaminans]|uniref:methyltransferase n=1 Tax=Ornithinibacillus contaminans TaxID=694055 RepID=UPI00064DE42F|nr:methyltransferase [Ornithinibacillus contaminans]